MKPVMMLERDGNGYLGLAYSGTSDTPRLGWFTFTDEFIHKAGTGYLEYYVDKNDSQGWLESITAYLKDGQNDTLRAREDIRWRVASRAQTMLQKEAQ